MSTVPVPEIRPEVVDYGVLIGYGVRTVPWIHAARLHNWVAGRGHMLVPNHCPLVTIAAAGQSEFWYRVRTRYQDTRLRYTILCSAETEAVVIVAVNGTTVGNSGGYVVHNRRRSVPLVFDVDQSAQTDSEQDLYIKLNVSGSSIVVESISIEALPRAFLTAQSASDLGSNRLAFEHRQPISERNFALNLLDLQSPLKRSARRSLFQLSWGTNNPWSTAVAGPTNVFDDTFGLIGRLLYDGSTTSECSWRVRAYCSDGTTAGTVNLSNTGGGASTSITIPKGSTSADWFPPTSGDPDTFNCDAEDNTDAWGLRGGVTDDHTVSVTRTAGSGTIYLESVCIWESPDAAPPAPTVTRITDADDPRITDADSYRITD